MGRSIAKLQVIKTWTASYDPALAVCQGDTVTPLRTDDEYPGWAWVENASGLGGWIPMAILQGDEIMEDFDTAEISLDPGDWVQVIESRAGWTRVRHPDGRCGWVPSDHLER